MKFLKQIPANLKLSLPDKAVRKQFIRYVIVGLSCFTCEYLLFLGLLAILGDRRYFDITGRSLANSIAMIIFFFVAYTLNRKWSFKSCGNVVRQLTLLVILFVLNLLFSNFMLNFLHDYFSFPEKYTKVLAMGMIVCWNFVIYRKVVYV